MIESGSNFSWSHKRIQADAFTLLVLEDAKDLFLRCSRQEMIKTNVNSKENEKYQRVMLSRCAHNKINWITIRHHSKNELELLSNSHKMLNITVIRMTVRRSTSFNLNTLKICICSSSSSPSTLTLSQKAHKLNCQKLLRQLIHI